MKTLKWIEVNIKCPSESSKDEYLTTHVKQILDEYRAKVESWHFLWEGKPYPFTLRLRFYSDDETISNLHGFLEKKLTSIPYCYGEHGDCREGKEYRGEAGDWGSKGWEKGVSFLEFGAEFALELIANKNRLGSSNEYRKDIHSYADRYTHLFLNQISSLLDEADFNLQEGVFRYARQKGKILSPEKRKVIVEKVKQVIDTNI